MKELVGVSHVSPPPSAFASAQPPRSVFADAQMPPSDSEAEPESARSRDRRSSTDAPTHPKAAQACSPICLLPAPVCLPSHSLGFLVYPTASCERPQGQHAHSWPRKLLWLLDSGTHLSAWCSGMELACAGG